MNECNKNLNNPTRNLSAVEAVRERQHHFFTNKFFMMKTNKEHIVYVTFKVSIITLHLKPKIIAFLISHSNFFLKIVVLLNKEPQ